MSVPQPPVIIAGRWVGKRRERVPTTPCLGVAMCGGCQQTQNVL
jgi:hypothetical protein